MILAMKKATSASIKLFPRWQSYAAVFLLMAWISQPLPVAALPVSGLYVAEIQVADQSERERRRAYTEAFARVITKVTGERRWLEQSQVTAARGSAERYVAEVSYRSAASGGPGGFLSVTFDQAQIDSLLNQAGIPVWDNNRASVLLWLTIQGPDGRRVMLGSSAEHALLDQVRQFAEERAVPVLIPLLDLEDRRLVTPNQAWALDNTALAQAAARYAADSVLAGRVLVTASGELVGLWQMHFRDDVQVFDHIAAQEGYMDQPLDFATTRLASYFGLVSSEFEREDQVSLKVEGIRDLQNHMQLIAYLESLSVVRQVQVSALAPDGLQLTLEIAGTRQMLTEFISLGRDLQPLGQSNAAVPAGPLHYRWTR